MAGRVFVAVAGAALLASAGAARAADIAPVVGSPIVVAPVVSTGPDIGIRLQVQVSGPLFGIDGLGEIDVRTQSGWGFTFSAASFVVPKYSNAGVTLRARTYRTIGNAEIGAFANIVPSFGPGNWDIDFGGDFTLDTARLDIDHKTTVDTYGTGVNEVRSETKFTYDATSRLTLETTLYPTLGIAVPGFRFAIDNELTFTPVEHVELSVGLLANLTPLRFVPRFGVSLPFDWITPSVEFRFYPGEIDTILNAELDLPLGASPFSLIGNATAIFGNTTLVALGARIGLRYEVGDPHEWN